MKMVKPIIVGVAAIPVILAILMMDGQLAGQVDPPPCLRSESWPDQDATEKFIPPIMTAVEDELVGIIDVIRE